MGVFASGRPDMSFVVHCSSSTTTLLALPPSPSGALRHGTGGSRSRIGVGCRCTVRVSSGGRGRRECGAWIFGGDARGFAEMPPQICDAGVRRLGHMISAGDMCVRCVAAGKNGDDDGERVGNGPIAAEKNDMGSSEKKFLTLPTILTLSRVAAVPALLAGTTTNSSVSSLLFHVRLFCNLGISLRLALIPCLLLWNPN